MAASLRNVTARYFSFALFSVCNRYASDVAFIVSPYDFFGNGTCFNNSASTFINDFYLVLKFVKVFTCSHESCLFQTT